MASKIRRNLIASVKSLDESLPRLAERLEDLKQYDHKAGSTEDLEVHIRIRLEKLQNRRSLFSLGQLETDRTTGCGELVAMKADIEKSKAKFAAITADTDELERLLLLRNYELPKRGSWELLAPYLARFKDFMMLTWRAVAASKRRMGHKFLLEWVAELDRMPPDQWGFQGSTIAHLKGTLIDLGLNISRLLVNYLWMITVVEEVGEARERLEEAMAVIVNLGIEKGSVVIRCFLQVVALFARTVGTPMRLEPNRKRAPWGEKEAEVFRMITVEILRLEVAFRSPDLPTRVQNSTYIYMAWHLKNVVFRDSLENIRTKICDFNRASCRQRMPEYFEAFFNIGARKMWLALFNATYERRQGKIGTLFKS